MKETNAPIKILHLEDNRSDSLLVQLWLKKENLDFEYFFTDNESGFRSFLMNQDIDIILSDYNLPGYSGSDALLLVKNYYPHIPFVFVSGAMGEETAIESLLNGAIDYVLKNKLERLGSAIKRALRESRLQQEYKKAIDTLRQKEEQYRTLVEGMNEGIMLVDLNDKIVFVNQQTCNITGYTAGDLIGKNCSETLYDPISKKINQEKILLRKKGIKDIYEIELLRKDHKKIWIRISGSPVYDTSGDYSGSIGVFENIDNRKKAEEELRKLTRAVDQSPDSIVITNTDGIVEYANPTTVKLTGYTTEELIGNKTNIFSSYKKSTQEYEQLWKTIKSGKVWEGEFQNRKKNGELYWESATISPIHNNSGNITHFLAIKEDITDRKKLTQELIIAKEKAEESDHLKSAFLANISHEIRTPMNGILGFAELLKSPELTPDAKDRYLHIIEQSGTRMLNIINDIVDISKIEAGQVNLYLQKTNINELLKNLLVSFTPESRLKGLKLSFSTTLPDEKSNILTDQAKLTQIMSNLIKNALKFTESGSIEFGYNIDPANSPIQSGEPSRLEFYVRDTGVGIPAEQSEMIFERFRQGSFSLTRAYEGAGLGLSISKAFVEILGGEIGVESTPGEGSLFYFHIPFKTPDQELSAPDEIHVAETSSLSIRVLIVDDDETGMLYLKDILEPEDVIVFEAKNGKEAVEAIKNHPEIDLVLMDLKMPVMDGYEATRQIKLLRPVIPVIAQTNYASVEDEENARLAGCDAYIAKPIKKKVLQELILKLM